MKSKSLRIISIIEVSRMKKILAFLFSFLLLSGVSLPVCQAQAAEQIDKATAVTLVKNAVDIMKSYLDVFQWYDTELTDWSRDIVSKDFPGYAEGIEVNLKPVKDGYDCESVKKLVGDTFTHDVAANYLYSDFALSFLEKYYEENGALYYPLWMGAQIHDHTGLELSDEDIEALTISDEGDAVVRTRYFPAFHEELSKETSVIFSFQKEDGMWKVSGMNSTEALFGLYNETVDQSSFSAELAKTEITAVLGEIYRLTHIDGGVFYYSVGLRDVQDSEPEAIERFGETFRRINGEMGRTEVWMDYCSRFTALNIAEKLVKDGKYCVDDDGRMFSLEASGLNEYYFSISLKKNALPEIISEGNGSATVKLTLPLHVITDRFGNFTDVNVDLFFEFAQVSGRWIITGGDFIEKLDSLYAPDNTDAGHPGTSDAGCFAITVAAALALALVMKKKQRSI